MNKPLNQIKSDFFKHSEYVVKDFKAIKKINHNLSNDVYRIELNDKQKFLMRYGKHNDVVGRFNEQLALIALKQPVIYQDPQNGMMIRKWYEGVPLTIALVNETVISNLIKQLKIIHQTFCTNIKSFDPLQFINQDNFNFLLKQNKRFISLEHFQLYQNLITIHSNDQLVLAHNDLNLNNIIVDNDQINIIDFEWVRQNNPYWDLASLYLNLELSSHAQWTNVLTDSYGAINKTTLFHYCFIVSLVDLYWCLLYLDQTKYQVTLITKYEQVVFWFKNNQA